MHCLHEQDSREGGKKILDLMKGKYIWKDYFIRRRAVTKSTKNPLFNNNRLDLKSDTWLHYMYFVTSVDSFVLSVFFAFSLSFKLKTKKQPEINNWKGKIEHDDGKWQRREIGIHSSSIICYTKRRADNIDHHSKSSLLRLLKSQFDFHSLFMPRSFWIISL